MKYEKITQISENVIDNEKKEYTNYVVAFEKMVPTIIDHPGTELRMLEADFNHYDIEVWTDKSDGSKPEVETKSKKTTTKVA